jgi:hypothetical protein
LEANGLILLCSLVNNLLKVLAMPIMSPFEHIYLAMEDKPQNIT